jgi:hypothetical protein
MLRRPHSVLVRGSKAYFGIGGFPITPNLTIGGCGRLHAGRAGDLSCTTRRRRCETDRFEDQYEDALKKKQLGQKIEAPRDREPSKVINLRMRYVALWKQNGRVANDGSQRRGITALQRKPAVPVHRQKRQAECVLRRGDAVVAVFQPYNREGFGATLAKCADTVNFCE